ncbi:hypothetical protein SAMN05518684_1043 [Salipaludibacillus aurantiacus]|uniref:Uncharacterized protein n=1 Tax=Salipaludibacillus aurantiacus TaxID=1601833 RepID=A0A1H9S503_9BACI|nr:hypothetical protein SAMN05518684_1043 [Salipaludibacillus aurantiacus]
MKADCKYMAGLGFQNKNLLKNLFESAEMG